MHIYNGTNIVVLLESSSSLLHPATLEIELEEGLDPSVGLDLGGASDLGALVLQGMREEAGNPRQARQCSN